MPLSLCKPTFFSRHHSNEYIYKVGIDGVCSMIFFFIISFIDKIEFQHMTSIL